MDKELEQPEVVAWRNADWDSVTTSAVVVTDWDDSEDRVESLMTVAQHERIIGPLCHARDVYFDSWKRTEQERDALAAQLAAREGWALVPLEPTPDMLEQIKFMDAITDTAMAARYRAMLTAVPQPVAQEDKE